MIQRYINRFTKKIIEAEQITIGKLNERNGIEKSDMNPDDEGYYFEEQSLKCWMHKKDFEYKYCPLDTEMSFGDAIELLKSGFKIQRKRWRYEMNQHIEIAIGRKGIAFVGPSGTHMVWHASDKDIFADDWIVVE